MTRHIHLSVEMLIKTALDGEDLTHSTVVKSGDGTERQDTKIHFHEDSDEVREMMRGDVAFISRLYPELRGRAIGVALGGGQR